MKKSAFTLIELLVVISIIAILAGIALPVLQKAQEKGRALNDLNNLKQLGVCLQAYLNDNGDDMFNAAKGAPPWPQRLASLPAGLTNATYASDWKVFVSPFDARGYRAPTAGTQANVSYGVNPQVFNAVQSTTSQYNHPGDLLLLSAAVNTADTSVSFAGNSGQNVLITKAPATPARGTHGARKQISGLFADFHASAIKWADYGDTGNLNLWDPTAP